MTLGAALLAIALILGAGYWALGIPPGPAFVLGVLTIMVARYFLED